VGEKAPRCKRGWVSTWKKQGDDDTEPMERSSLHCGSKTKPAAVHARENPTEPRIESRKWNSGLGKNGGKMGAGIMGQPKTRLKVKRTKMTEDMTRVE